MFGIFVVRGRERWWLVAATILSFVLSWGRFLPSINNFLFYNLPLYSKFRAPSMALVIASLTMVTLGILAVKRVVEANDEEKKMLRSRLLYSAAIVGGILIVFALFGAFVE